MLNALPAIFACLVGGAGWFYLFFSKSATRLVGVEGEKANRLRVRLRRLGGAAMLLLAVAFYWTITAGTREPPNPWGVLIGGSAVILLLVAILILALADLRLTRKFRNARRRSMREGAGKPDAD